MKILGVINFLSGVIGGIPASVGCNPCPSPVCSPVMAPSLQSKTARPWAGDCVVKTGPKTAFGRASLGVPSPRQARLTAGDVPSSVSFLIADVPGPE